MLAEIGDASPEIFGRTVDPPTISVDDPPDEAVRKLEDALGRDLPDDFGRITVFDVSRLRQVQDGVSLINHLTVVAVVAGAVLMVLTHWLAPHRRRTLLQLTVGVALGLVVVRWIGNRVGDSVVDFVTPENREAARVVVDAFLATLRNLTGWMLGVVALVATVAMVTGPYRWAEALRHRTVSLVRALAGRGRAAAPGAEDPTTAWLGAHREALQIGGLVAGIVTLLVVDVSWLGLVLLTAVVGGFELFVWRMGRRKPAGSGPPEPGALVRTP